jgi:hypothetical protein
LAPDDALTKWVSIGPGMVMPIVDASRSMR